MDERFSDSGNNSVYLYRKLTPNDENNQNIAGTGYMLGHRFQQSGGYWHWEKKQGKS